jgi:hypothetical protein
MILEIPLGNAGEAPLVGWKTMATGSEEVATEYLNYSSAMP